jgi:hypothetical protein
MSKLEEIIEDLDNAFSLYMTIQPDPDPIIISELGSILERLKELQNEQTNN